MTCHLPAAEWLNLKELSFWGLEILNLLQYDSRQETYSKTCVQSELKIRSLLCIEWQFQEKMYPKQLKSFPT